MSDNRFPYVGVGFFAASSSGIVVGMCVCSACPCSEATSPVGSPIPGQLELETRPAVGGLDSNWTTSSGKGCPARERVCILTNTDHLIQLRCLLFANVYRPRCNNENNNLQHSSGLFSLSVYSLSQTIVFSFQLLRRILKLSFDVTVSQIKQQTSKNGIVRVKY